MKEQLTAAVMKTLAAAGAPDAVFTVEPSNDATLGEYATNAAFAAAKQLKASPKQLAEKLAALLSKRLPQGVREVRVAGPGFINFFLTRDYFSDTVVQILKEGEKYGRGVSLKKQKVMVEYTDPNPFKEFHIGHLMSNAIGESVSRLIEFSGAEVKRACYQGDVGLHVAKAIWGMKSVPQREGSPLDKLGNEAQAHYLGHAYQIGAAAYGEGHKEEIEELNKKIYDRSDAEVNKLYDWGRKVSLEYFARIYERLGTKFDFFFFESEMAKPGLEIVRKFLPKGLFEESDGAVVFRGEKYDPHLHTRVFITSQGLPTYEAKELALHIAKAKAYPADRSVVITANEQDAVFSVGLLAFKQIDATHAKRVTHISHGILRLPSGKMSSRTGDVITAESLIARIAEMVREKIKDRAYDGKLKDEITDAVSVGALKYSILRQAIGGDIVFDFEKSISFEGDSGPYLQYAATRAGAVLEKAKTESVAPAVKSVPAEVASFERLLAYFPEIAERAGREYAPHLIVTYLIELAGAFNSFYAKEQIVGAKDVHSPYKVALTKAFRTVMENGLRLLGIGLPAKM